MHQADEPKSDLRTTFPVSDTRADTISIAEILESHDSWGVPHFQRGSVWGSENVSALLESLYSDTPCGSIILWTPKKVDQYGVPLVRGRSCTHLLIDGQQRTRSVYAAFKGFGQTRQEGAFDQDEDVDESPGPIARYWAINLAEVPEFESVLHRPEKRLWPLFVAIPDPYLAERQRLKKIGNARRKGNTRYTVPESPFKYNFVPLHVLLNSDDIGALLKLGRLFAKRHDGHSDWSRDEDLEAFLGTLERVRANVQRMKSRRLFRKVLGEHVSLDEALRVFVRINSGGRPVQEEEKAFSVLVGRCPSTSDWVRKIFEIVHGASSEQGGLERDEALQRLKERSFGFKLFIRVFMLAASYHTNRAIGGKSLSFGALQDRRSLALVHDRSTYDNLWTATADVVVATRRLLESRLELDALQFLPETTALFPLFMLLIKYPRLVEGSGAANAHVNSAFESGMARLALLLLLRDPSKQESLTWANEIAKTHDDAEVVMERLAHRATIDAAFFDKRLREANSLSNRYTLLLYALQRSHEARDFNYAANELTGKPFEQPERELADGCEPEKQHIVPYSHLIGAFNLEFASRVSSTEANNIGNITYISHEENSLGGLSDRLVELEAETGKNLQAHFIDQSRAGYEEVKVLINGRVEAGPVKLKKVYTAWIQSRRAEIGKGFSSWLGRLQREWLEQHPERQAKGRIEPVPAIFREPGPQTLAYALRSLDLPDRMEDALIGMFLSEGWRLRNAQIWQVGDELVLALQRKRRIVVNNVRLSRFRLTSPTSPSGIPQNIDLSDTELALRQLNDLKDYLDRCNELKGRDKGGNQPQNRKSRASGPRTRITRDELLAAVGDLGGHADAFASFVDDLRPLGVYPDRTTEGVALRFPDPAGSRQQFRIARVRRTGRVRIGLLRSQLEGRGYSTEPVFKQVRTIVGWLPGALVDESGALIGPDGLRNDVSVGLLMKDWREQYGNAVRELLDDIRKAAADATARPIAVNARAVPESGHGAD